MSEKREASSEEVLDMIKSDDILVLALDTETQTKVLHMVAYKGPITEADLDHLEIELKTDEELGMTDVNFVLVVASEYIRNQLYNEFINREMNDLEIREDGVKNNVRY